MKYIVEPTNDSDNGWVLAKRDYDSQSIAELIRSSEVVVSDLDDTIAPSPIKELIRSRSKERKYRSSPKCWAFALPARLIWRLTGKKSESILGKIFTELFLRDNAELQRISQEYTSDHAKSTLYPGVSDFYKILPPEMRRILVTRTIEQIAEPYGQAIGFDDVLVEQYNKRETSEKILNWDHPRRFIVIGDSPLEQKMYAFLKDKERRGEIESVLGIYVADSPENINPKFDINIPQNYSGLVKIMQ